ncbi:hypothetical protein [Nocardia sp. NPDC049149]
MTDNVSDPRDRRRQLLRAELEALPEQPDIEWTVEAEQVAEQVLFGRAD